MPAAGRLQYAFSKHVASRRQLLEPLLSHEEGPFGEEAGQQGQGLGRDELEGRPAVQGVYSWWASKLWWSGLVLVLLAAALCFVTIVTVFFLEQ